MCLWASPLAFVSLDFVFVGLSQSLRERENNLKLCAHGGSFRLFYFLNILSLLLWVDFLYHGQRWLYCNMCTHIYTLFGFQFDTTLSSFYLGPRLRVMRMIVSTLCGQRDGSWAGLLPMLETVWKPLILLHQKLQSGRSWARFGQQIFLFFYFHHFHLAS